MTLQYYSHISGAAFFPTLPKHFFLELHEYFMITVHTTADKELIDQKFDLPFIWGAPNMQQRGLNFSLEQPWNKIWLILETLL